MSPEPKTWKSILQPAAHLKKMQLPLTTLRALQAEPGNGLALDWTVERLQVRQLGCLGSEQGVNSLIEGYARGVMAVTGRTRIAIRVTSREDRSNVNHAIVVARCAADNAIVEWDAFVADCQDPTEGWEASEFGLYLVSEEGMKIDLESPVSALGYHCAIKLIV
jgi:hypothetical protein